MPDKEPPDPIISSTAKSYARKRILVLGLIAASSKTISVPNINLSGKRMLNMNMRKSRGNYGKLKSSKLSDFELHQLISVLEIIPSSLLRKGDTNPIILDTGFSRSATGFTYDFVEVTLVPLFNPHLMDGIGASLEATH